MKRSMTILFALFIVLVFMSSPAISGETQAPAKVDRTKIDPGKEKVQSKDVKGKTEKNTSQKADKALGESVPRIPPIGPAPGPVGNTSR